MYSETAISVSGITKQFSVNQPPLKHMVNLLLKRTNNHAHAFQALSNISFNVYKGETIGIIGRNGAGKSTLLQIICGTLHPDAGHVSIHGKVAALLELGAGFNPEFSGRENIYLSALVYGLTPEQTNDQLSAIIDFAEIGEFIDRPVKTYSSGMFVRLAFSIIAHVRADILVIDEALAVGDVYFTQKCMRFLKDFSRTGTLIFVSHDTTSVVNLCDRAIWIEHGSIKKIGSARSVADAYLSSSYVNNLSSQTEASTENNRFGNDQFGLGGGKIIDVALQDSHGNALQHVLYEQQVTLKVSFTVEATIHKPIIGFFVKDRLGQHLFGTNTLTSLPDWQVVQPGAMHSIGFNFIMPLLATGNYSIGVALASGTQTEHVQHHWIHDATVFRSSADPHLTGIITMAISAHYSKA